MALRLDYLTRETGQNLVRNPLTAIAIVTTVAVSLTMASATLLLSAGVDSAFSKWNNDVSFIVYVNPQATGDQIASLRKDLGASPQVDTFSYLDHAASYTEFKRLFKDDPTIVSTVKPDDLPTSFRVKPSNPNAAVIDQLANQYKVKAGVMRVDFPSEAVRAVQRSFSSLKLFLYTGSIALLIASFMLIFNSIQTAVFARRREIEVMKLVGATNWFIRVPFILEGLIQGVLGAFLSWGALIAFQAAWHSQFNRSNTTPTFFDTIQWTSGDFRLYVILTIVVGALVGSIASFISTTWYLRV
jgi:cell division transport system permease protein